MSAGTITLTNGSDAVTGTGTTFTTDLVAGDFVVVTVGGITYTLPVKAVVSDTALTLIKKYTGPTQANSAWNAVPRAIQNQVTAELVVQSTEYLRGLNYDKANWQAVFSASGDITVMLPDGSTFTGPSWKKISDLLEGIDPVALQALADQISASAQQVAADRLSVDSSAQQVALDKQAAVQAAGTASNANEGAQQAKTDAAASALQAHNDKEAIGDLQAAVDGVNGVATLPLGLPFWWFSRNNLAAGSVPYDGQEVSRSTYPSMFSAVQAGTVPVVTEAAWWADPSKRNSFTLGATAGMFRLPDYNGAQVGSVGQATLAGGTASQSGIFHGELPNLKEQFGGATPPSTSVVPNKLFKQSTTVGASLQITGSSTWGANLLTFDANQVSNVFKDTATDVLAARVVGVWCGQLFGRVTNPGDVDGATLSTRMEAINTDLLARFSKSFISGFNVLVGPTTISVSSGAYYDPGSGLVLTTVASLSKAIPATAANTWYHLYLFKSGNTVDIEISTVEPVDYSKPAKIKTGDTSRRYIGSYRTGTDAVVNQCSLINGVCDYFSQWATRQFMLSAGISLTETPISLSSMIPSSANKAILEAVNVATSIDAQLYSVSGQIGAVVRAMKDFVITMPVYNSTVFYRFTGTVVPNNGLFIYGGGYHYER